MSKTPLRVLLLGSLVGLSGAAPVNPDLEPAAYQPALSSLVTMVLASEHFASLPMDDVMSERWFDNYIETLDYGRMFFTQADIDSFQRWRDKLDDAARAGEPDLTAAFHIHSVYRQRMAERMAEVQEMLDQPLDFTTDATFDLDRTDNPWPKDAAEAKELWRKRITEQALRGVLRGDPVEEQVDILKKRYHRVLSDTMKTESSDIFELYMGALTHSNDPHSDYFAPATNDDFDIRMSNSLEGIGASLRAVGEYITVIELLPGGPAMRGGKLQKGDRIVKVAQADGVPVDVVDERIGNVVKLIRGPKGTEVRLTVLPKDAPDPSATRVIAIERDEVVLEDNDADKKILELEGADGHPLKVGVIDVPSFYHDFEARRRGDPNYKSTTRDVRKLLQELRGEGVHGVILDLRMNGGGSLSEAIDLTGLFIDKGPIVQIGDRNGRTESMEDTDRGTAWDGPLMVLTSPLSASASEILAGAVQDYGRGLVVGSASTHGKGTVQNVLDLDPIFRRYYRYPSADPLAGALKVTTAKFYRVSGGSTQLKGVRSDVVVPSPWDGLDMLESDLDYALPWDRVGKLEYEPLADLAPTAQKLQALSAERVAASEPFTELVSAIHERKETSSVVSLNLETRRAELAKEKVLKQAAGIDEEGEDTAEEDGPDLVLDEAAAILRDWLTEAKTAAQHP